MRHNAFGGGGATLDSKLKKLLTLWGKNHIAGTLLIFNSQFKKAAFTLAEVLITLTILGVVAAISISTIATFYQKTMTIARLKVAYSMVENMTRQSYIENGYPIPVGTSSIGVNVNNVFNKYFGRYLNITKNCGTSGSGCFKSGSYRNAKGEVQSGKIDMFYNINGYDANTGGYEPSRYYKVLLKNGMSLAIYTNVSVYNGIVILVDINGPNHGDSKLGQDVFQFNYYSPVYTSNSCKQTGVFPVEARHSTTCDESRNDLLSGCKSSGKNCAWLIMKDGWKISSDYPWKQAYQKVNVK